jgi:DNA-directed RNA polymerase
MQLGIVRTVADQLILERKEMFMLGADRYELLRNQRVVRHMESLSGYGNLLVELGIDAVVKEIRLHRSRLKAGRAGIYYRHLSPLLAMAPHKIAACALRVVVDRISTPLRMNHLAMHVADKLWVETMLNRATRWELVSHKRVRGRFSHKVRDIWNMQHTEAWTTEQRAAIGGFLVSVIADKTGLVKIEKRKHRFYTSNFVSATDACLEFIRKYNDTGRILCPFSLPMLVPPRDWSSPTQGGYLSDIPGYHLLKSNSEALVAHCNGTEPFIRAANHQQSVAWQVNRWVLEQMEHAWEKSIAIGKLIPREGYEVPPYPKHLPDDDPAVAEWRHLARQIHDKNDKTRNKRIAIAKQLWLARKFVDEPRLHYPMQLDFRGRYYYKPPYLNPQTNDVGRALLHFANGTPIRDEQEAEWLWVHGANLYGYSKLTWRARLDWAHQNKEAICRSGMDPWLATAFWTQADDPWQFLAFCRAAYGYVTQRHGYVCQLPVVLDCTCSGIQHYSALLRNEQMAELVNLMPSDKPQDIYSRVLNAVLEQLRADGDNPHARSWLELQPDRSLTKAVVMTMPYSATRAAVFRHCQAWAFERMLQLYGSNKWRFKAGAIAAMHYMTTILANETANMIGPAKAAMLWFKRVGRIAGENNIDLAWTSPSGLLVRQRYPSMRSMRITLHHLSPVVRTLQLDKEDHGLDKTRMANGLSPNVIHSLDASHMAFTTVDAFSKGVVNLGGIHDCFATTPSEMRQVRDSVRNTFAAMYSKDWLATITSELLAQIPAELQGNLPERPVLGDLDINQVRTATYFIT